MQERSKKLVKKHYKEGGELDNNVCNKNSKGLVRKVFKKSREKQGKKVHKKNSKQTGKKVSEQCSQKLVN